MGAHSEIKIATNITDKNGRVKRNAATRCASLYSVVLYIVDRKTGASAPERKSWMNVRKPIDYSAMFAALDTLMAADLPQMKLYCEIGRLVSGRPEKGAAVAAAEYLCGMCPDVSGFSPRNLRRMRAFYRTYESSLEALIQTMTIGWTQNVVILEAELTLQERAWYIRAVQQFGWSKLELQRKIAAGAHLEISLDFTDGMCYTQGKNSVMERTANDENPLYLSRQHLPQPNGRVRDERPGEERGFNI